MKRLNARAKAWVEANLAIAGKEASRARRYQRRATFDELYASAYYGLCIAASGPARGDSLRAIAHIACRRRIIRDQAILHRDHIGRYPVVNEQFPEHLQGTPADQLEELIACEDHERLVAALWVLTDSQRDVIDGILAGRTGKQLAASLHLDHSTVSAHLRRGIVRLRGALHGPGAGQDTQGPHHEPSPLAPAAEVQRQASLSLTDHDHAVVIPDDPGCL